MQGISSLENVHRDEDIYVVGGGKSLDFYPENFFKGRIVLAVNQASRIVPASYVVRKEFSGESEVPVIASVGAYGGLNSGVNIADYVFEHNHNNCAEIDPGGLHPCGDKIVVSWSTITSAIHIAAFMGARAVFLAGHDCATIDGEQVASGYYDGSNRITSEQDYSKWLAQIAPQTAFIRDYLQNKYGIPLISLSPFIGLKHEGHLVV